MLSLRLWMLEGEMLFEGAEIKEDEGGGFDEGGLG